MIEDTVSRNIHLIGIRHCVRDVLYIMGELKPNYPMPAIKVRANIYLTDHLEPIVDIEQHTQGTDNGRYWSNWEVLRLW
jgi:hypothetical protein